MRQLILENRFLSKNALFLRNVLKPLFKTPSLPAILKYVQFFIDWMKYKRMSINRREKISSWDWYPCLFDKTATSVVDAHYFYLGVWGAKKIYLTKPASHVDVGSQVQFIGFLTTFTDVIFVDIRPLEITLDRFKCRTGNILNLPFNNNSVPSISCLHVVEHIGLGRYGDTLDPEGSHKACKELVRTLAPGGNLFFAVPIGAPRVCFNAHRIFSVDQVIELFRGLVLKEFSLVDDNGKFHEGTTRNGWNGLNYGCGMFWFTNPNL